MPVNSFGELIKYRRDMRDLKKATKKGDIGGVINIISRQTPSGEYQYQKELLKKAIENKDVATVLSIFGHQAISEDLERKWALLLSSPIIILLFIALLVSIANGVIMGAIFCLGMLGFIAYAFRKPKKE